MKHACRKRTVDIGNLEYIAKMFFGAGSTGCDQRHIAYLPDGPQLSGIVALTNAVLVHAIQYDLACTALLCLAHPVHRAPVCRKRLVGIARVLIHEVVIADFPAIDTEYDALCSEPRRKFGYQLRVFQRRCIDGNLVGTLVQDLLGIRNAADAPGDTEGYVDDRRNPGNPAAVDAATVGTRSDVVKDQLVSSLVPIAFCKRLDLTDDTMIPELYAFDDDPVPNVQAGNYPFCRNDRISVAVILRSSKALPVIAAGIPASASARMSSILRTPPEAWS